MLKNRRLLVFILVLALVFVMAMPASVSAAKAVNVTVNGEQVVWTDAAPFIDSNERTMVPLRAVADALGIDVEWLSKEKCAKFTGTRDITSRDYEMSMEETVEFYINEDSMYTDRTFFLGPEWVDTAVNEVKMDTAPIIRNSRTYAPIRYLAESFGYKVDWDKSTRTVIITDAGSEAFPAEYPGLYAYVIDKMGGTLAASATYSGQTAAMPAKITCLEGNFGGIEYSGSIEFLADGTVNNGILYIGEYSDSGSEETVRYTARRTAAGEKVYHVPFANGNAYFFVEIPDSGYWVMCDHESGFNGWNFTRICEAGSDTIDVTLE